MRKFLLILAIISVLCLGCSLTNDGKPRRIANESTQMIPPTSATVIINTAAATATRPTSTATNTLAPTRQPTSPLPPTVACTPRTDWPIYIVTVGDTVSSIASRSGTTTSALATANCLSNPGLISVGQQLRVPRQPVTVTPAVGVIQFFFSSAVAVDRHQLETGAALVPVQWKVDPRPARTNLVFEQITDLVRRDTINIELPRTNPDVPSEGTGFVRPISVYTGGRVYFLLRLVDTAGRTLTSKEFSLPIIGDPPPTVFARSFYTLESSVKRSTLLANSAQATILWRVDVLGPGEKLRIEQLVDGNLPLTYVTLLDNLAPEGQNTVTLRRPVQIGGNVILYLRKLDANGYTLAMQEYRLLVTEDIEVTEEVLP